MPVESISDYFTDPNDDLTGFYIRSSGIRREIDETNFHIVSKPDYREMAEAGAVGLVSAGIIGSLVYFGSEPPKTEADLLIAMMAGGLGAVPVVLAYGVLKEFYSYIRRKR